MHGCIPSLSMIYNFPQNIGHKTVFQDQQVQAKPGHLQLSKHVRYLRNLELRSWLYMRGPLQGTLELLASTILRNLGPRGCGV
jgi:hypothetical protein